MLRLALTAAVVTAASLTLAGTAVADDAQQTCTDTLLCTGHVVDVHDFDDVVVSLLSVIH